MFQIKNMIWFNIFFNYFNIRRYSNNHLVFIRQKKGRLCDYSIFHDTGAVPSKYFTNFNEIVFFISYV